MYFDNSIRAQRGELDTVHGSVADDLRPVERESLARILEFDRALGRAATRVGGAVGDRADAGVNGLGADAFAQLDEAIDRARSVRRSDP